MEPSSSPPQYPGPPDPAPVRITTTNIELGDPDLKIHIHPHSLLVSITRKDHQILPTVLHYWDHDSSIAILTKLTENQLQHIRGFQEVGTFSPPVEEVSDSLALHRHFTPFVAGKGNREAVDFVVGRLEGVGDGIVGVTLQIFIISVFGVECGSLLRGGLAPVWKWAKPESVYYRKTGFWEAEVESAITDEVASLMDGNDAGVYEE
ncbi:hypothetical protein ETB97_002589 [Aspergillus alliaceus]|uniref:Uncharacterized protein n=1 Tax=Petromyces alliaceus TaxID=209559 RepID=A0A5N7CCQ0_PETAA|nr:hypothetical protein BDV23DRAFT_182035 [Aspergillus alliaceus]KAF5859616.1 hypothetical protein ETB97_002589 [Aspergillus burnettii]